MCRAIQEVSKKRHGAAAVHNLADDVARRAKAAMVRLTYVSPGA